MKQRLDKVQSKDQEIREQKLDKEIDSEHKKYFEKIHKEMYDIMADAEKAKTLLKDISKKEETVNELLNQPEVQRPLNKNDNIKKSSDSQKSKGDKKIVKTLPVKIDDGVKTVEKINDAPIETSLPKSQSKVKAVVMAMPDVTEVVNANIFIPSDVDSNTFKTKTEKDNSFDANVTDNKAPRNGLQKSTKAVVIEKKAEAIDSDILKSKDALLLVEDTKKEVEEKVKSTKKNDSQKKGEAVVAGPAEKVVKANLSAAEVKLAQAGLEIDQATATELFGHTYTNYALRRKSNEMLENAMNAVKLVEIDLKGKKFEKMPVGKNHK